MPILGALLAGLFASLAEFFTKYLSKKLAFAAAAIGVFSALTIGLGVAISALVQAAFVALPDVPGLAVGFWLGVPDNTPFILSSVVALDTAVALYKWNLENLKIASYIT